MVELEEKLVVKRGNLHEREKMPEGDDHWLEKARTKSASRKRVLKSRRGSLRKTKKSYVQGV